jgi:hypothetical protein
MDDRIGTAETSRELARDDVGGGPLDLREVELWEAACEPDDGLDRLVAPERVEKTRAHVPCRTDNDHPHERNLARAQPRENTRSREQ